jgi:hypothetical protein
MVPTIARMARFPAFASLLLLPLAAACAKGFNDPGLTNVTTKTGTGTPGTGGGTPGTGGGAPGTGGSGGAGCGLVSMDATCNSCLDQSCCNEALACANDSVCGNDCLGTATPPSSCDTNAALNALGNCLNTNCNTACGTSSSSGPPSDCIGANDSTGCCDGTDTLYYCTPTGTLKHHTCASGTVCGWDISNDYYGCVPPPGGEDPSGAFPQACGG